MKKDVSERNARELIRRWRKIAIAVINISHGTSNQERGSGIASTFRAAADELEEMLRRGAK